MKKILFLFVALLMISIDANQVSAQSEVYSDGNVKIMQYIDGWKVLHGDNVVAHGDGVIDVKKLPPAFKDFLCYYSTLPLDKSPRKGLSKSVSPTYGPLLKTQWEQREPYNTEFPIMGNSNSPTGCTSIASAQLMYYFRYCNPINVSGTLSTYYGGDISSKYISNVKKNDYNLTFDYSYKYTPDFEKIDKDESELAKFILGVAFAQKAAFGEYFTKTNVFCQQLAFEDVFGYQCEYYDIISLDDRSLIIDAIKRGIPVLISGNDGGMGHSFVIDGFNGTEYHFNYGWYGYSDGWFTSTTFSNSMSIIIVHPNYDNYAYMQNTPKSLHISGNGIDKTIAMVSADNTTLSYKQSEEIELAAGEYEFYFEYADGSKIAPYLTSVAELEKGFATHGCFISIPAKVKLGKSYRVDFCHTASNGEIKVFCTDLQVPISGKVQDEDGKPMAGVIIATSETMPISEAYQKNDNEVGWICALPLFSATFVSTKPYLTQVDFKAYNVGNPKELSVSIRNARGDIFLEKSVSAETIANSSEWVSVEMDSPLPVTIGETYYFVIENPECDVESDSYFSICNDSEHNLLYRIWSSDTKYVKTDTKGEYALNVDKHTSGRLYAFYNKTTFEPLTWDNIQNSTSNQNFNGISTEVTISGKVLSQSRKPIADAYVSLSSTKPNVAITQENNVDGWTCFSYMPEPSAYIKETFVADQEYLTTVDVGVKKYGTPGDLFMAIIDQNNDTLYKATKNSNDIQSNVWTYFKLGESIELQKGQEYTIFLKPDGFCDEDNYYMCPQNNDNSKIGYRLWASDSYVSISDRDGNYSFTVDRYSSTTLYAFYNDKSFNALTFASVDNNLSGQDFIGDFETPVSEIATNTNVVNIYSYSRTIYVQNVNAKDIHIVDASGRPVKTIKATSDRMEIPMQTPGIYIVRAGAKTQKVMIR